jgi:hypothetical protein
LFVNFCRDPIGNKFRESLFSNQEFAIAYALGFERLLVVNQEGLLPEGMLRYLGINIESFRGVEDCLSVVCRVLDRAAWTPDYSRRLRASGLRFSEAMTRYGYIAVFSCIWTFTTIARILLPWRLRRGYRVFCGA